MESFLGNITVLAGVEHALHAERRGHVALHAPVKDIIVLLLPGSGLSHLIRSVGGVPFRALGCFLAIGTLLFLLDDHATQAERAINNGTGRFETPMGYHEESRALTS